MEKSLQHKLTLLRKDPRADVFILADARDADMAWGIRSPGETWPHRNGDPVHRSMDQYLQEAREIVEQGVVDLLLASVSSMSLLAHRERRFETSTVTPAIRANDSTDIWLARGAHYSAEPSRPFSTCSLAEAQYGRLGATPDGVPTVNLGLYSLTFTNNLERDRETLLAFKRFREDCAATGFRYFLEVFAPNVPCGLSAEQLPAFLNDQIVRSLAGVSREHWPEFLKIPYLGPRWLEELVQYDSGLIVGILGGSSGTSHDAFKLLADAKSHGARAALFGRRIKDAEHPLTFISFLRRVAEGQLPPDEAVRAYHGELARLHIAPKRSLEADLELTQPETRSAR